MIELEETNLTDPHAGGKQNRDAVVVTNLQGDSSLKTRIDESGGNMCGQTVSTKRRLSFKSRGHIVRHGNMLHGFAEHKLSRIKLKHIINEGLLVRLYIPSELPLCWIDVPPIVIHWAPTIVLDEPGTQC